MKCFNILECIYYIEKGAYFMKYVAFLDVLGFKDRLKKATHADAQNYIQHFSSIIYVNDTLRMYKNDDIRMYNFDCITDTIVEVITTCNTYTLLTVHLL